MHTLTCTKCGKKFSTNIIMGGKKIRLFNKRKYCLKCVPYKKNANRIMRKHNRINICHNCSKKFSTEPIINNKRVRLSYTRKYCLKCVPYKKSAARIFRIKGKKIRCIICDKWYEYNWRGTVKICRTCYTRKRRKENKNKGVEYLGGKCVCCGWDKYVEALNFHHVNPKNKKFTISHSGRPDITWESLKKELDKCVLLCANCHAGVHAGHIKVG